MKKLLFALAIISTSVRANPVLTQDFKTLNTKYKVGTITEQTYCYEQQGQVGGYQVDKKQRIASVTKLLTTLLASEVFDLNQTFQTKVYIGKDGLHIEGGLDPYFEEEKMLLLMRALNDLGHTKFKQVSFNSNFRFYDLGLEDYQVITSEQIRQRIAYYFNPKNQKTLNTTWKTVQKFAREEGIELEGDAPSLSATSVVLRDVNPLQDENPVEYVHHSKPLHAIIKAMNVMSKNVVAENLFALGQKKKSFRALMLEKNVDSATFSISNGSGLPIINGKKRFDNLATCRMILKSISLLSESAGKQHFELSDIVAVNGGKDLGSFRNRFEDYPETHESVLSKTGTLKHTSSLAGVLLISGEVPFAILNHTKTPVQARKFQDHFVDKMFDQLGTPTPLVYEKISIFPWDGEDFLQLVH
ncbi:D-alanyl-D-alanine carboxypeptidase [Peredibacter sp. HCB2-198]|uniref:D-alanyl-D-alanine carboxypeptidase n=1 Tax=Peredibacter sp. HCB2-198 TaxID=3383025 RepID=UPI0038B4CE0A